jgi:hypothetical protein
VILSFGLSSWPVSGVVGASTGGGIGVMPFDEAEEAEEIELDDADLNVYFWANLLAIPTKIGSSSSSSSVLSPTKIVSSAASFALPFPFDFATTVEGARVDLRVLVVPLIVVVDGAFVRVILFGLGTALVASTSMTSSEEPRWIRAGRWGRDGPASG